MNSSQVYERLFKDHQQRVERGKSRQKQQQQLNKGLSLPIAEGPLRKIAQMPTTPSMNNSLMNQSMERPSKQLSARSKSRPQTSKNNVNRSVTKINTSLSQFNQKDSLMTSNAMTPSESQNNSSRVANNHNNTNISPPKIMHQTSAPAKQLKDLRINTESSQNSIKHASSFVSTSNSKVEDRLINYAKTYGFRRNQQVELKQQKEREPSKEKPDINNSSGNIVEQKKLKMFDQIFNTINTDKASHIDPSTANYRNVSLAVLDLLMDVFTDFEYEMKPWDKKRFIEKCNEAYQKMPQGDRSELLKISSTKDEKKDKSQQQSRASSRNNRPEINQNSKQLSMNTRQYGQNACETLYKQHQQINRKKEQLKEKYHEHYMKDCTFKPTINNEFSKNSLINDSQNKSITQNSDKSSNKFESIQPVLSTMANQNINYYNGSPIKRNI